MTSNNPRITFKKSVIKKLLKEKLAARQMGDRLGVSIITMKRIVREDFPDLWDHLKANGKERMKRKTKKVGE